MKNCRERAGFINNKSAGMNTSTIDVKCYLCDEYSNYTLKGRGRKDYLMLVPSSTVFKCPRCDSNNRLSDGAVAYNIFEN